MLAGTAGAADSIGFLEFSQLFMSFMSGNTTRFGVAVAGFDWDGATRFASVIALFCFGACIGTLIAAWSGRFRLTVLLIIQAVLFAIGLFVPFGTTAFPLHAYPIVLALGIQNATLQDEAGRSLAITYVTGTVVRFGAGIANLILHKPAPSFWLQAPLWGALSTGAVIGGFLHGWYGERAFLFPAGLAALLAVVSLVLTVLLKDTPNVSGLAAPQPDAHPEAKPTATVPAAT
ncbi:conserved protein of unknown function; putative membrane protein [Methylorubrum extorquens DM4]|uniref:DUF1275 family protein n=2 Tax=Methylorubrum extorquens TaxID=408 RepID=C7CCS8_METED|nr:conserved protein of unknown function; putative membrane protein [Methylorubrum extorquens DM4]